MNRDIVLGVSFSLALHGLLLWMAADVQREAIGLTSPPATLDLSIVKTSPHRGNPGKESTAQETPQRVPNPMPTPLRSFPEFAEMKQTTSRKALTETVKRKERTVGFADRIQKKPPSQPIPPPEPIRNARVILKAISLSRPVSETGGAALATPKQWPVPDTDVPSSGILSRADRLLDNLEPSPPSDGGNRDASIGDDQSEPPKPSNKSGLRTDIRFEASLPHRSGQQVIEAVPDYAINPKPVYPRLAIRRNYEGSVTLLVEVLSDGTVREIQILESSGHAMLDRSALKAVRKWRFKPGTRGGQPVTMKVKVPVVFRLKGAVNG